MIIWLYYYRMYKSMRQQKKQIQEQQYSLLDKKNDILIVGLNVAGG